MKRALLLALGASILACGNGDEDDEVTQNEVFMRMQRQPKFLPYQRNDFYADKRAMQPPPAGTLSREQYADRQTYGNGLTPEGAFVQTVPIAVDSALLHEGKKRFEVVCASCHGMLGDGVSMVAKKAELTPPPSFHTDKLRLKADGYIYKVASDGFGLMPSFSWHLTPKERWAVVAYIRALQLSQHAPYALAPESARGSFVKGGR